jgi:hypothetical protein
VLRAGTELKHGHNLVRASMVSQIQSTCEALRSLVRSSSSCR